MPISLKYIYFLLSISFIYSSLYFNNQNIHLSENPDEFINKIQNSDLNIQINIGSEKTIVKASINMYRTELMLTGNGVKSNKYNESNSDSYNCTYCNIKKFYDGWYSEGVINKEDFFIPKKKNEFKIHNMKFILSKSKYMNPPEAI